MGGQMDRSAEVPVAEGFSGSLRTSGYLHPAAQELPRSGSEPGTQEARTAADEVPCRDADDYLGFSVVVGYCALHADPRPGGCTTSGEAMQPVRRRAFAHRLWTGLARATDRHVAACPDCTREKNRAWYA